MGAENPSHGVLCHAGVLLEAFHAGYRQQTDGLSKGVFFTIQEDGHHDALMVDNLGQWALTGIVFWSTLNLYTVKSEKLQNG